MLIVNFLQRCEWYISVLLEYCIRVIFVFEFGWRVFTFFFEKTSEKLYFNPGLRFAVPVVRYSTFWQDVFNGRSHILNRCKKSLRKIFSVSFNTNTFNIFAVPLNLMLVINSSSNVIFEPVTFLAILQVCKFIIDKCDNEYKCSFKFLFQIFTCTYLRMFFYRTFILFMCVSFPTFDFCFLFHNENLLLSLPHMRHVFVWYWQSFHQNWPLYNIYLEVQA